MRTVILIGLIFGFLGSIEAEAQFFDEVAWPPEVEIVAPEGEYTSGGTVEFSATVKSEFGLHVYRDKLEVGLDGSSGVVLKELILPEGTEIPDLLEPGSVVRVFDGEFIVRIVLMVTARAGESAAVKGLLSLQGCTDDTCYPPEEVSFDFPAAMVAAGDGIQAEVEPPESVEDEMSLLGMLLTALVLGLGLSLTPCVLPMIPITSAIILRFTKGGMISALFSSVVYVLGLAITYGAAGAAVAFLGAQVRSVFQSPWFLGTVALIFVILAMSMFGLFDIALPSGFSGKMQQRASTAGKNRLGLLFMGMISGLVIGPCVTAPLAAFLLLIADKGSIMVGFWTMFTMAWGMGLLIIVAGISTGLVPKAGEWTEWVKKLFAFVMLWGALYFMNQGLLIQDLWFNFSTAVLLVVASVFLGGFDQLPAEAGVGLRIKKLVGVFLVLGGLFLGLHTYVQQMPAPEPAAEVTVEAHDAFQPGGKAEFEVAVKNGQPVILYFTADWCVYCKELKKRVFADPEVVKAMDGLTALKVDVSDDLARDYRVTGVPTVVFIDGQGEEKKRLRFSGADISSKEFIEKIHSL